MTHTKMIGLGLALLTLSGCGLRREGKSGYKKSDHRKEVDVCASERAFNTLFDVNPEFGQEEQEFSPIYFGFNSKEIVDEGQKEALAANIEKIKEYLADASDYQPTIVIEGHACSSAGKQEYNLALSQARAEAVFNACIQAGIPEERLQIVARGQGAPAFVEGEPVTGDRSEQALNRRCEVYAVYA